VDVSAQAGITQPVVYGGIDRKMYILETTGCGMAFIDYDNDGWMDLFVPSGTRVEGNPAGATNRLYKNNRDGTFTDVTEKAGLLKTGWACGVTVGDYNNDGFPDLFVTYYGQNVLYRNNGDGTFTDVTAKAGLLKPGTIYGSGCTWVDYNRDGHLDLFVSQYIDWSLETAQKPGEGPMCNWKGVPVNCGPRGLKTGACRLYRNNGDGTFTDVTAESGVGKLRGSYSMTCVAADFDNDGWPDIYVACDSTPSFLLRNQHDGTFREEGLERGVALSDDGDTQAGMGVGVGDYDLDGSLDIFKTHFADDTHVIYRNDGQGLFEDMTSKAGLTVETRFVGWGAGMADLDNDGLPDLFIATGSVYPEAEAKLPNYPYKTPRLIFRNLGGGRFEELIDEGGPGVTAAHSSRGCAFGDFDNDGDIDMLVMNMNEPPSLLRNDTAPENHWMKFQLIGTESNRSAIGSRVTLKYGARTQAQEVVAQSSFYSSNDQRLHFGLGVETGAEASVRWTNGKLEKLTGLEADHLYVVKEGQGVVKKTKMR
jgi:hypothetical protein